LTGPPPVDRAPAGPVPRRDVTEDVLWAGSRAPLKVLLWAGSRAPLKGLLWAGSRAAQVPSARTWLVFML
jgi:hypothetical protein